MNSSKNFQLFSSLLPLLQIFKSAAASHFRWTHLADEKQTFTSGNLNVICALLWVDNCILFYKFGIEVVDHISSLFLLSLSSGLCPTGVQEEADRGAAPGRAAAEAAAAGAGVPRVSAAAAAGAAAPAAGQEAAVPLQRPGAKQQRQAHLGQRGKPTRAETHRPACRLSDDCEEPHWCTGVHHYSHFSILHWEKRFGCFKFSFLFS